MASQSSGRQIPNSIEDINPTATHVDRPTLNQINSVFANSQFKQENREMRRAGLPVNFTTTTLLVGFLLCATTTDAAPITHQVTVQPIQICDDLGMDCAMTGFSEAETDKIWAQAGIDINFLALTQFNSSQFLDIADIAEAFNPLGLIRAGGDATRHPDPLVLNMWFVEDLLSDVIGTTYGFARINGNGMIISDEIFDFNGGIGRLDTIAHEIGHNLALGHDGPGIVSTDNLMASQASGRMVPSSINDINPSGSQLDKLTQDQIDRALQRAFVRPVPEPSDAVLLVAGASVTAWVIRRRRFSVSD